MSVTLDGTLHSDNPVEHNVDEDGDGENIRNGRERRKLVERVTSGRRVLLDEALGALSVKRWVRTLMPPKRGAS